MILLNTKIWAATVEEAKAKAAGSPAWLRAIEKADQQARRGKYWAFDSTTGVLKVMSASSNKLYTITAGEHSCEAIKQGHKACWHRALFRLMQRYTEALGVVAIEAETVRVQNWSASKGHEIREMPRVTITPHPMNTKEQRRAYWAMVAALPHTDLDKRLPKRAA